MIHATRPPLGPRALVSIGAMATALGAPAAAHAIGRDEVVSRAKSYAYHPWTATAANLTASCDGGYHSVYTPGDYLGLPYDWGGYMTLYTFDTQIAAGYGAGSYPDDGVLDCTAGVDCSGFVSKAWDVGHYTTSSVSQTSSAVALATMLPGDIFNYAGFHMALYSHTLGNGEPALYESVGYNVHYSTPGWSWLDGYTPRRLNGISGSSAIDPVGTPVNPIVIDHLPFVDSRDTTASKSDLLDGCSAAPDKKETGREYVYEIEITQPGTLTAAIQDDVGVDIDVHIYTSMNANDCVARHDTSVSYPADCGTYYVVADTFKGSVEYPGAYTLTVSFTPSNQACGNGPPSYQFEGALGSPCAYPGHDDLPFCNPNLDATTCIYTSSASFCSKACAGQADCSAFGGGCCADIGNQEFYCLTAAFCGGGSGGSAGSGPGVDDPPPPQGDPGGGGSGAGAGAAGGAGAGTPQGGAGNPPANSGGGSGSSEASCSTSAGRGSGGMPLWLGFAALALASRRARRTVTGRSPAY